MVVTARATDPDGVSSLTLNYRPLIPPPVTRRSRCSTTARAAMRSRTMEFIRQPFPVKTQRDAGGVLRQRHRCAGGDEPISCRGADAECHVRWGKHHCRQHRHYRLWLTAANVAFWTTRERNANDTMDATFVVATSARFYNVDTMYAGSPFHSPAYNGPLAAFACDYEMNFPE